MTDTNALADQIEALAEKATTAKTFSTENGMLATLGNLVRNNLPAIIAALRATDHPTAEDFRNRAERAEQECAEKDAEIARLEAHAARLEEQAILHTTERTLFLNDPGINAIVQRHFGRGKWLFGSEGYVRSTAIVERATPENSHDR